MRPLSPKAQELIDLLTATAKAVIEQRGWSCKTTAVTLFCPQNATAALLGVDPSTIRRWFYRYPQLREWVAIRPHYTSISAGAGKRTVIDGTLWTVRLQRGRGEVRVPIEDLRHSAYRNLEHDIRDGRTLNASQVPTGLSIGEKVNYILGWAFNDRTATPVSPDACSLGEAFAQADWDARARVPLGRVLARALGDRHSGRYWIGQVLRWAAVGRLMTLKLAVERVLADAREGFARRPPALLVRRLTPATAVG